MRIKRKLLRSLVLVSFMVGFVAFFFSVCNIFSPQEFLQGVWQIDIVSGEFGTIPYIWLSITLLSLITEVVIL